MVRNCGRLNIRIGINYFLYKITLFPKTVSGFSNLKPETVL